MVRSPLALLLLTAASGAARVTVRPGDMFRDSLLLLGSGDTLFFSPGEYTLGDDLPLLQLLPSNDGVVITCDPDEPGVLNGQGYNRPVLALQGPLGSGTVIENLVLTGGNPISGEWFGGGGIFMAQSDCAVMNTVVSGNSALMGGGIFIEGGAPLLDGLTVQDNTALVAGGGVCIQVSSPMFSNSVIRRNSSGDDGGGVFAYLGVLTAANLLISGNHAGDDGGGVMQLRGTLLMSFCTIEGNSCADDGAGILISSADSTALLSSIVTGNQGNGGIQRKRGDEPVFVSHCCAWGNGTADYLHMPDPTGTRGNISMDPMFADSLLRLSHIQAGQQMQSPCVDAGHRPVQGSCVQGRSTRTDSLPDSEEADMGYHFDPLKNPWSPPQPPGVFGVLLSPCPTPGTLTIRVITPDPMTVRLFAFDTAGRLVADLGSLPVSGTAETAWPVPPDLPSGVLFIRCSGPAGTVTGRTVVLR